MLRLRLGLKPGIGKADVNTTSYLFVLGDGILEHTAFFLLRFFLRHLSRLVVLLLYSFDSTGSMNSTLSDFFEYSQTFLSHHRNDPKPVPEARWHQQLSMTSLWLQRSHMARTAHQESIEALRRALRETAQGTLFPYLRVAWSPSLLLSLS